MAAISRIFASSVICMILGAVVGLILFGCTQYSEYIVPTVLLAAVGGIIGTTAGTAQEIVLALQCKASGVTTKSRMSDESH